MRLKTLFCLPCVFLFAAVCAAQELHQHAVQILTGLVKIDTSNPPGNEIKAVQEKLRAGKIFYNSMLRTSVVPTIVHGGFRENVIPAEAEATLDVRALPGQNMEELTATLRNLIDDPKVEITRLLEGQQRPAAPPSDIHNEMFSALERAQKKIWPKAITLPVMQTGATDSAQLRAKGVQAYGIGIPLGDDDLGRIHGNDERISLEALAQFTDYLWTVVTDVAATKK